MALSAYDEEGRLKKHALRGTGLGAATGGEEVKQRKQFEELHAEAQRTGMTREGMKATLQSRFDQYGGRQQSRMAQIAEQRTGLEARYAASGDAETERRFSLQQSGGPRPEEFRAESRAAWEEGRGMPKDQKDISQETPLTGQFVKENLGDLSQTKSGFKVVVPRLGKGKDGGGILGKAKSEISKSLRKTIEKRNARSLKTFRKDRWNSLYDWRAERAYNDRRAAVAAEIDETYIGLGTENEERQALIQDKLELYNMFLGE